MPDWIEIFADPNLFQVNQEVFLASGKKRISYFVTKRKKKTVILSTKRPRPRKNDDNLSFEISNTFWNN